MAIVKNLKGTSDKKCNCGSWLEHWERFTNSKTTTCSVLGCFSNNIVGGHVQKVGPDNTHYIIPLCQSHNMSSDEMVVSSFLSFASANKSLTCEK